MTPNPLNPHRLGTLASNAYSYLFAAATLVLSIPNVATAIDGYKDFKFGLTPESIKKTCPSPLEELPGSDWGDLYGKDCKVLVARNFRFMDADREASFVFTKKGLVRVVISLQENEIAQVKKGLDEKYPPPILRPSPEEFRQMIARFDAAVPNSRFQIDYEAGAISLTGIRNGAAQKRFVLQYIDLKGLEKEVSKPVKDDL